MKTCLEEHPYCKDSDSIDLPERLRVIDVTRRCLIEKSQCDFVALSYVWGPDVD
jgi:hypothetical protein